MRKKTITTISLLVLALVLLYIVNLAVFCHSDFGMGAAQSTALRYLEKEYQCAAQAEDLQITWGRHEVGPLQWRGEVTVYYVIEDETAGHFVRMRIPGYTPFWVSSSEKGMLQEA